MLQINAIGFVGNNAKIEEKENNSLITFSVCTSEKRKNKSGEYIEVSQWINCFYYVAKNSKLAEYIKQGNQIFVQGSASFAITENNNFKIYLTVQNISLLTNKANANEIQK